MARAQRGKSAENAYFPRVWPWIRWACSARITIKVVTEIYICGYGNIKREYK